MTKDPAKRREIAKELIKKGVMQGYLAYDGDRVVGWCSCDDKTRYKKLRENREFMTDDVDKGKIKAIYCYDIAPSRRGEGIAHQMLEQICVDAKNEGFSFVEG